MYSTRWSHLSMQQRRDKTLRRACDGTDHHLPKSTNDPGFRPWISGQASAATPTIGHHPQPSRRLNRCMRPQGSSPSLDGACWNAANLKTCTGAANSGPGGKNSPLDLQSWAVGPGTKWTANRFAQCNASTEPGQEGAKSQLRGFKRGVDEFMPRGSLSISDYPAQATSLDMRGKTC